MPGGLPGHWQRVNTPLRELTRRERRIVAIVAIVLAISVAALVAGALTSSNRLPAGCIDVVTASATGAGEQRACGNQAKDLCQAVAARHDPYSRQVQTACRRSGILKRAGPGG